MNDKREIRISTLTENQIKAMELKDYDRLPYVDRAQLATDHPSVFSRLMEERKTEQANAVKEHNRRIYEAEQPTRHRPQQEQKASYKPFKQPLRLDDLSATEIRNLTLEQASDLQYVDWLRLYNEFPETYARIKRENSEIVERQQKERNRRMNV